jgi:exodeoxyribonuclease VII small subunit
MTGAARTGGPAETISYTDALAELDAIVGELEAGDADIDLLAARVQRAAELVDHCRGRLGDARVEVMRIVGDLDPVEPVEPESDEVPEDGPESNP